MGKQQTCSWEFKLQMVHLLAKGTHNMSQISRDYHVTRSLLYAWMRLYQEQVAHLERLCGEPPLELDLLREEVDLLKKAWQQLPSVPCHALIERLRELMPNVSVRKLCALLDINRQWYYQHRRPSAQENGDRSLCQALQELRKDFAGYGYRRMTKALKREGWKINHKRVERVMRQAGLTCRRKPRSVHTTDSKHGEPVYPNLLKDLSIEALNQCWVADLTYVRLPEGFVYLACITDAYSRKCLGWSLSRKMESSLPLQATFDGLRRASGAPRFDPPL